MQEAEERKQKRLEGKSQKEKRVEQGKSRLEERRPVVHRWGRRQQQRADEVEGSGVAERLGQRRASERWPPQPLSSAAAAAAADEKGR